MPYYCKMLLYSAVYKIKFSRENNMDIHLNAKHKNCYCTLWDSDPSLLKERGIPYGYCGICKCGQCGHLRHAPTGPYTDEFCDKCYRRLELSNFIKLAFVIIFFICLVFSKWLIASVIFIGIIMLHGWQMFR